MSKWAVAVLFLAVTLGLWYYLSDKGASSSPHVHLDIAMGLERVANSTAPAYHRVAIGYNANLDLIVHAADMFRALGVSFPPGITPIAKDHAQLDSLDDLKETFSFYAGSGSAAERYVSDSATFQRIIDAAVSVNDKVWHLGGNAGLMANRFAQEGCDVLLGGVVGDRLGEMLDSRVQIAREVVKNAHPEANDKVTDEIHLIAEYAIGSMWGTLISPRANRFIIVKDETNAVLQPLEDFHEAIGVFSPSLVVIAGLHLLEGKDAQYREARLMDVVNALDTIKHHEHGADEEIMGQGHRFESPVHLELASIGSTHFMAQIGRAVVPVVDSLGLNEQELGSLYESLGGTNLPRTSFRAPQPETVVEALGYILKNLDIWDESINPRKGQRRLMRVHFHCLTFHMVVQRTSGGWSDGAVSVAAGSLAASRQACNMVDVDVTLPTTFKVPFVMTPTSSKEQDNNKFATKHITADKPVVTWTEGDWTMHVAPVAVCRHPSKTVGLGDAISAVGLLYHTRS